MGNPWIHTAEMVAAVRQRLSGCSKPMWTVLSGFVR